MYKYILVFLFLSFSVEPILGQGFNNFSGRNHPELNWKVAETEHFKIAYPQRIAGIEQQVAAIAEETYAALSKNLEVEFDYKIRIYLSNEDEVNNGFAFPASKAYTDIWVNLNDYSEIWTGSEKWLRKVVAHELAHIFHFEAVKSPIGLLQYVFSNPIPSFWTEGLAQYETEHWDAQRGDRWLRKAVFDDNMNYQNANSIENGKLRYALGNAQLRYFTEKYGDSTLVELLSHRSSVLGIKYHDFYSAFDEVIDGGYSSFYDDWRKHTNVYYNTLASQMERVDSLNGTKIPVGGQFYYDAALSPNDSLLAVLSLQSMKRPVRQLSIITTDSSHQTHTIAEGGINSDLQWMNEHQLVYSRTVRGKNSSLVNDLFLYDLETDKEQQIIKNRRAKFPAKGASENQLVYVVNEGGTGNLFSYDLLTKKEQRITSYSGDVQLLWPLWIPSKNKWLVHQFDEQGNRNLVLIHPKTGRESLIEISNPNIDNRKAILSPDGNQIAYVSLRDEVPNVFSYDFETEKETRLTNVFTGAELFGWASALDTLQTQQLIVSASESRNKDQIFAVEAGRNVFHPERKVPESYASWRKHRPPHIIPSQISPDGTLITDRYSYSSVSNITHLFSLGLPYYSTPNDWGVFATTNWIEPLAKHTITAAGVLSIPNTAKNSYGFFNYLNNQLYPTLAFSVYNIPNNAQFYGSEFLIENQTGATVSAFWPLDALEAPYQSGSFSVELSYYNTHPFGKNRFTNQLFIKNPVNATVASLGASWQLKKQRPWAQNSLHPLDGYGIKVGVKWSEKALNADVRSLTTDLQAFAVLPALGLHRIYVEGRFQSQWGNALPQQYIGFSRYDNISVELPAEIPLSFFGENNRVRGYKSFITGDKVAFGSLEYRVPLVSSLQTQILGMLKFGGASLSLFTDGGIVGNALSETGETGTVYRWGAGAELKNKLTLFGLNVTHSLGMAQPSKKLFTDYEHDFYYRVKAVVPF